jgi:KaiC/GvpD/RAD55 family RecA-like ATPase
MTNLGGPLPVEGVAPGSTLLLVGPPMAGKRQLALRTLAAGVTETDPTALITTDSSPAAVRAEYGEYLSGIDAPVTVVDGTGGAYPDEPDGGHRLVVSTPSDLGAIGTATMDALEDVTTGDQGTPRIGLLSLTSLTLSSSQEEIVRFTHSLTQATAERDGLAVLTGHTESFERADLVALRSLVDGVVSVRPAADGVEVLIDGIEGVPASWTHISLPASARADVAVSEPPGPAATTTEPGGAGQTWRFDSLADLVQEVDADRPTLTICNRESSDDVLGDIETFFDGLGITVRTTRLSVEQPRDVALLHRGPELIAASSLTSLAGGIAAARADADPFEQRTAPDVLTALNQRIFRADGVEKQFLIDASTAVEMTAWRTGEGRLYAGFQELSRYWESERTRRVMGRLADNGVEVRIVGVPDIVPAPDHANITVIPRESAEVEESWFVAYDGDGRPDRKCSLVVRELEPEVYNGFWTFEPSLTSEIVAYLDATYTPSGDAGQQART